MADKKADGPAKPGGAPRAVASVNDAVRIATEASLTPSPRPSGRREAAALKASSPRMTAAMPAAAAARELGSIAPVVATDTPAATMLAPPKPDSVEPSLPDPAPISAAAESEVPEPSLPDPVPVSPAAEFEMQEPSLPEPAPTSAAVESEVPEPSLPDPVPVSPAAESEVQEPSLPEPAPISAAAESEVPGPSLPEPAPMIAAVEPEEPGLPDLAPPSVAAESEPAMLDVVPEWIATAAAPPAEPADASPVAASLDATVAETLPEPSPAPTAELSVAAARAAVVAVNVPTPTPRTTNRTMETIMTTAEDFMSFQQGNFEALVKSSQIWASGLQDLGRHFAATAQAQMDETMGTVKAIVGVKSLREAVELQSTLARSSMEKAVTEGGKITDATMKLAEQTMAPITARLTLAAEKFGRTSA